MLLQCTCQKVICSSIATYKPQVPISSCAYEITIPVYIPQMNPMQSTLWLGTLICIYFTQLAYTSEHICPTALLLWSTYSPTLLYIQVQKRNNNLQQVLPTLLLFCARNKYGLQMPHMQITSCAHMWQQCQYIYLIWTYYHQQCDQEHWYT